MTEIGRNHNSALRAVTHFPARREFVLVVLMISAGLFLRFAVASKMSVEHFDEGVFASNLWFAEDDDFQYPERHLYAPPVLPALTEWSLVLFGTSHMSSMLVSLLAGSATILLVWWSARRWFGREAGIAAATLAALSDFHLLYCRTVLTDVLLCFWWLSAVFLIVEAYRRQHLGWAVAAGLAAGLAWSTKYNGWLPVAIGLAGPILWALLPDRVWNARWLRRRMIEWVIMALTAGIVWTPVWIGLWSRGGYSAVLRNHRRYLVGIDGWFDSLQRQMANHDYLDGWLSCLSLGLSVIAAACIVTLKGQGRFTWNDHSSATTHQPNEQLQNNGCSVFAWLAIVAWGVLFSALAAAFGSSVMLAVLGLAGIGLRLGPKSTQRFGNQSDQQDRSLPACMLTVWFLGLLLSTPFYTAYPRLTLPWLVASWLLSAAAIGSLARTVVLGRRRTSTDKTDKEGPHQPSWRRLLLRAAIALMISIPLLVVSANRLTARGIAGWQSRTGLERIAGQIIAEASRVAAESGSRPVAGVHFVIYVYAEPGLVFHLSEQQPRSEIGFIARPIANLEIVHPRLNEPPIPTFLVAGPNAERTPQFSSDLNKYRNRFRQVRTYRYRPSNLVLLNLYSPAQLAGAASRPHEQVRLFLRK